MLRQLVLLSLLIIYFSGLNNIQASPLPSEDTNHDHGSESGKPTWKICPTYGSFHGDVVKDFGCCLDEKTCSAGHNDYTSQVVDVEDNDLPPLLRTKRFKRSTHFGGGMTRNRNQYIFDNILTSRNPGEAVNPLMEVSLCESKAEIVRPAFGTKYGPQNPVEKVQIYQLEPFLVQAVFVDICDEKPTAFLHGECRQRYEPQEMFVYSENSTDSNSKGLGIDRVFVAVPMGCSTFINPTHILNMLNLQREANANKDRTLVQSSAGTSVNYNSYTLNNKPVPQGFRDITISDQPAQQSLNDNNQELRGIGAVGLKGEETVKAEDANEKPPEKKVDEKGRDSHEHRTNIGDNDNLGNPAINLTARDDIRNVSVTNLNEGPQTTDFDVDGGKAAEAGTNSGNPATGSGHNESSGSEGDLQTVPRTIKMPVYFGSKSLLDPVQQFLRSKESETNSTNNSNNS
jgi:hypothetical protein